MKNKWLRMLVCFVLVCGILVNISPIRARSVVVDTAVAVSGVALLTWAYLAAAGVVYIPQSVAQLNAFEKSLDDWWSQNLKSDEDWNECRNYVDNFNDMYLGFMEPDAPRPPDNKLLAKVVGTAMGTALAGFAYGVIKDQAEVNVDVEDAFGVPMSATTFNYYWGSGSKSIVSTTKPVIAASILYSINGSYYRSLHVASSESNTLYYGTSLSEHSFKKIGNIYYFSVSGGGVISLDSYEPFLSDDIYVPLVNLGDFSHSNYANNAIGEYFADRLGIEYISIDPDAFVGDIPDQVKNGTLNAESLPLPDTFDLTSIVSSPETALQDVQSLAQQLSDGGVTYNDYITNITYVEDPEPETTEPTQPVPGTGTDPTTPSDSEGEDSGGDSEDEEEKLEELEFYTLDLTEFFPFCIPFDIYEFFSILSATPQAPVFDWPIVVPALGLDYTISVDLSPWNDVAALFRKLELMAFIVGLGFVTRKDFLRG